MCTAEAVVVVNLNGAEQTVALGRLLAQFLSPGAVLTLDGPLGSGKTTLVTGLLGSLGSSTPAASPTYNLLHIHPTTPPIYHFDAWRLSRETDFESIGGEDYLYGDGISVVEWSDKIRKYLPDKRISVELAHSEAGRVARVRFVGYADSLAAALCDAAKAAELSADLA